MLKQIPSSIKLQLCSRCLNHEINSWVNEKWTQLGEETKKQIREELKTIKLTNGNCIVCHNNLVSENVTENILQILDGNHVIEKLKKEFQRNFCI